MSEGGGSERRGAVEVPIREMHLATPRTARVAVLDPDPTAPLRELWVALHGYRQLAARFLRSFRPLARSGRRIVAPEGLSRFYLGGTPGPHRGEDPVGASWMTREDREAEIADYVGYLDRVVECFGEGGDPAPSLTVVGFSQGVHTAARWVARGRTFRVDGGEAGGGEAGAAGPPTSRRGARLILWGAALPRDLPRDAAPRVRSLGALLLVRGEGDGLRNHKDEAAEEARLRGWGIRARIERHPGGHRIDAGVLLRITSEPPSAEA